MSKQPVILFSGGGSGGSVSPLVAVYQSLSEAGQAGIYYWLGTYAGPEKKLLAGRPIKFRSIFTAKWHRYFTLINLWQPFKFLLALTQALYWLRQWRPQAIISAGSFVSVPVALAGRWLGIKVFIHQQDIQAGLANKIMATFADVVTASFPEQAAMFQGRHAIVTGNPVRAEIVRAKANKQEIVHIKKKYSLKSTWPLLLVLGGGTGATQLNNLLGQSLAELTRTCQIFHVTGPGKNQIEAMANYLSLEFVGKDLPGLMAAADLVVSRAGMSTLCELAVLGKASLIIPMPNSHQELNAQYFADKQAIELLSIARPITEKTRDVFVKKIKLLLSQPHQRQKLSANIAKLVTVDAAKKQAAIMRSLISNR